MLHDRNPPFVLLSDGGVRNGYTVKILNKLHEPRDIHPRPCAGCPGASSPSSAWKPARRSASRPTTCASCACSSRVPPPSVAAAQRGRHAVRAGGARRRLRAGDGAHARSSRSLPTAPGAAHEPDDVLPTARRPAGPAGPPRAAGASSPSSASSSLVNGVLIYSALSTYTGRGRERALPQGPALQRAHRGRRAPGAARLDRDASRSRRDGACARRRSRARRRAGARACRSRACSAGPRPTGYDVALDARRDGAGPLRGAGRRARPRATGCVTLEARAQATAPNPSIASRRRLWLKP